jgi:hypothetical protein
LAQEGKPLQTPDNKKPAKERVFAFSLLTAHPLQTAG